MGSSKWLTIKDTSKLLGITERTVYRYMNRGILEARVEGKTTYISEDAAITWKKGRHDILDSPLQQATITKMLTEMATLKTQVATCMRLLNVRHDAFNLSIPEFEMLYRSADQLSTLGWSPHEEETWADYFVRFRVEDFEKIEMATSDKHPWRPLLRLASSMYVNPYNKTLLDTLAAGRTHIQQLAGIWCVLKEESPRTFDILQERDAVPFKKLIRKMQRS